MPLPSLSFIKCKILANAFKQSPVYTLTILLCYMKGIYEPTLKYCGSEAVDEHAQLIRRKAASRIYHAVVFGIMVFKSLS